MAWTCPSCGRNLTVRNQEHTCGLYDLDSHFDQKDPLSRLALEWMLDRLERLGPIDVLPLKTTIAFASGANVAFLTTKRRGALLSFVLPKGTQSSRFLPGPTAYGRAKAIFRVKVLDPSELDEELEALLNEAYAISANPC
jgi:hypothetical protein